MFSSRLHWNLTLHPICCQREIIRRKLFRRKGALFPVTSHKGKLSRSERCLMYEELIMMAAHQRDPLVRLCGQTEFTCLSSLQSFGRPLTHTSSHCSTLLLSFHLIDASGLFCGKSPARRMNFNNSISKQICWLSFSATRGPWVLFFRRISHFTDAF